MGIFSKKPQEFEKDRTLFDENTARPAPPIHKENANEEEIHEIFSEVKDNIELSNRLLNLLDKKCRATHVPVDSIMQDVRAAVARKDPSEADGARISFHLFLTAVKKFEQVKLNYAFKIMESTTGNLRLDSVTQRNYKNKILFGLSDDDLAMFDSVYLLNYAIHKFQDIFNVPDILKISPPSEHPEGAAYGAMKLVIAIAFASAIDVLNKILIRGIRSESSSVSTTPAEQFQFNRLESLAMEKVGENDYKNILDYVINYIYASSDPKYDLWVNYISLRKSRNSSVDVYKYYPTYSSEVNINMNLHDQIPSIKEDDAIPSFLKTEFLTAYKNNFIGMCGHTATIIRFNNKEQRMLINNVAQSSAYIATKDQICCLLRIMAKQKFDKKVIKMIIIFLKAISKTLAVDISAKYARKTSAVLSGARFDYAVVMYIKHKTMDIIRKLLERWVRLMDVTVVKPLYMKCKLFHDMLKSILNQLEKTASKLNSYESKEQKKASVEIWRDVHTAQVKWQVRRVNEMQMILNSILAQSLEECFDLSDDITDNIIDDIVGGLDIPANQYTIDIPDDLRERYFSDNEPIVISQKSELFGLDETMVIPAIDKFNQPETSEEVIRNILKTCKMEISDEEIKKMLKESDGSSR